MTSASLGDGISPLGGSPFWIALRIDGDRLLLGDLELDELLEPRCV